MRKEGKKRTHDVIQDTWNYNWTSGLVEARAQNQKILIYLNLFENVLQIKRGEQENG